MSHEDELMIYFFDSLAFLNAAKQKMAEMSENNIPIPYTKVAQNLLEIEFLITEILIENSYGNKNMQPPDMRRPLPKNQEGKEGLFFEANPN